ncbi:E3 ubiquitin-protein ligase TRIM33-like [Mercenaria mercenaria]|uniref:E3 ubiquitin-protein ligase TRIM33-like n=1 Tax=Mercenaria mercenaria TaxID=6596 RepID=UPI00234E6767|nr:E3 ubiquitin-protein ligase TRIM33-like [Mercenaria mercenaria]
MHRRMGKYRGNQQQKPKYKQKMDVSEEFANLSSHESGVFCEICLEFNGEHTDVYGFCTNCKEYLCKNCCDYHCKPKPSRDHKLVYKADMPELDDAVKTQSLSGFHCPRMCETHPDMPAFLKCDNHKKQICTLCASIMHMSCKTQEIQNTETRFLSKLKLERTFTDIDEVITTSNGNIEAAKLLSAKNEQQTFEAIDGVEKLTEMLHREIDSAMKKFILKINDYHKENKAMIDAVKDTNEKANQKASQLKKHLQTFVEEERYSHLYCGVQNSTEIINTLQVTTKTVETESKYKEILCRVDKRLYEITENPELFVLVSGQKEAQNFPMYRELSVPSEYVEGRIPGQVYEELVPKRNNTGSYDYVYTFLPQQRKS